MGEDTKPAQPIEKHSAAADVLEAAMAVGPVAAVALDHYLNSPKPPEPPKVELPPGVDPPK